VTAPPTPPTVRPATADDPPPDAVVVGVTGDGPVGLPDGAPVGLIGILRDRGEIRTGLASVAHVHDADGVRWILVGLGDGGPRHDEDRRAAYGAAIRRALELRARAVRVVVDDPAGAPAAAEAIVLAAHRPARIEGEPGPVGEAAGATSPGPVGAVTAGDDPADEADAPAVAASADDASDATDAPADVDATGEPGRLVTLAGPGGPLDPAIGRAVEDAVLVARAQNEARRLQQLPANHLTPRALAREAVALGREVEGLRVRTEIGRGALQARGMGLFDAVARGSDEPPALIVAEWDPTTVDPDVTVRGPVLGLVGKAVTHDTGGYSLKTPAGMVRMKLDMSGGAAVLQAIGAIARLRLPVRVVAVVASTENLVNGSAMKPGDVHVAGDGTSVEIVNTDAEGRLVLADALLHAVALGAERLVDVATLTGGVVTALGTSHGGLLGRDEPWLDAVRAAGERTGERVWPLPLEDDHRDLLKSTSADLKNSGGRSAHVSQGAAFLERFSVDRPWAHLDMAGLSDDLPRRYLAKGPSGWGVRILVETARALAAEED